MELRSEEGEFYFKPVEELSPRTAWTASGESWCA